MAVGRCVFPSNGHPNSIGFVLVRITCVLSSMSSEVQLAALPRSALHLQLLRVNGVALKKIYYRDQHLAKSFTPAELAVAEFLGREKIPRPRSLFADLLSNKKYYESIEVRLSEAQIDTLIIFLEGEPLERFIVDRKLAKNFQLWEEGLSHYVNLTSSAYYAARGFAQILAGFYPRGAMSRRAKRSDFEVFDRFEKRNLQWSYPASPTAQRTEVLLIGSPLVEDRLVSEAVWKRGIAAVLQAAAPNGVRYLPHPREDLVRLRRATQAEPQLMIESDTRGVLKHVEDFGYTAYIAAVSTALLDIGRLSSSVFVPKIFGLTTPARRLGTWRQCPVAIADTAGALTAQLQRICHQERTHSSNSSSPKATRDIAL